MKINIRPLNKGETFCCSIKSVKDLFKNTGVNVDFAYYGRNYSTMVGTVYDNYFKNNIKGQIIASFNMDSQRQSPILSFYVIKEKDFSPLRKKEFEEKYLPKFMALYEELLHDENIMCTEKFIIAEFVNGNIVLHEKIANRYIK